jgi:flagellar biosynthesis/type III secretory pathway chaperone
MDYQMLFNAAFTLSAFLAGWVLSSITKALDRLDNEIRRLPMTYVSKADYRIDIHDIKELLQRIDVKLDGKADK